MFCKYLYYIMNVLHSYQKKECNPFLQVEPCCNSKSCHRVIRSSYVQAVKIVFVEMQYNVVYSRSVDRIWSPCWIFVIFLADISSYFVTMHLLDAFVIYKTLHQKNMVPSLDLWQWKLNALGLYSLINRKREHCWILHFLFGLSQFT